MYLLLVLSLFAFTSETQKNIKIFKCVIESCAGWRLNQVRVDRRRLVEHLTAEIFSSQKWRHSFLGTLRQNTREPHLRRLTDVIPKLSFTQSQDDWWRGWDYRTFRGILNLIFFTKYHALKFFFHEQWIFRQFNAFCFCSV